jgi:sugar lactone lactonase YvrE
MSDFRLVFNHDAMCRGPEKTYFLRASHPAKANPLLYWCAQKPVKNGLNGVESDELRRILGDGTLADQESKNQNWEMRAETPKQDAQASPHRCRQFAVFMLQSAICSFLVGCGGLIHPTASVDLVWGRRGISEGRLQKPRAMTIDSNDELYLVDMTARIQVFSADGEFLRGWRTPEWQNGKPTGLSIDNDGNLLVADTHYYRVLTYTPQGKLLPEKTIGGASGRGEGEFGLVTDVVQDTQGNYYVCEYGGFDRIQKFSPTGEFVLQWGGHGVEPGQFIRPQGLAVDENDHVWVADSCNHRVQVFDARGDEVKPVRAWGEPGDEPGQLRYPYCLALDGDGHVYVCEWGNHRVQKFTLDGQSVAIWGDRGRQPGQLHNPWAIARDSKDRLHVLDTYNHRVQRVRW